MLPPVTEPITAENTPNAAAASSARNRQAKDPFSSIHETASAVRVIHTASLMCPVSIPQIIGTVPDKAMRKPQLSIGSMLSSCNSLFSFLYDSKYATVCDGAKVTACYEL
jgi:hypothetical protein